MPVWPGVLLCVLAPHPACIRYKVRPAWLVGGENGRKFAMHAQNTPKRAISSEQGEFYTAHAVRRGVLGEFYTGSGPCDSCRASFVPGVGPCDSCRASFIPKWPGVILVGDVVSLRRSLCVQLSASRRTRAPQPALRRVHHPPRRRCLLCRRAQRAPASSKGVTP